MIDLSDCLTVLEAAAIAQVSPEWIRKLIREKVYTGRGIDATKLGHAWFIRKGDLQAYLAARDGDATKV